MTDTGPTNFFDNEAFSESTKDEKLKLLRLIADHGTEGQRIYDEARTRWGARDAETVAGVPGKQVGGGVPANLLKEVETEYQVSQQVYRDVLAQAQVATKNAEYRQHAANAMYADLAAGDEGVLWQEQNRDIEDFNAERAALRAAGRGGGGGGSGRGRDFDWPGLAGGASLTLPVGFFDDQVETPGDFRGVPYEPNLAQPENRGRTMPATLGGRGGGAGRRSNRGGGYSDVIRQSFDRAPDPVMVDRAREPKPLWEQAAKLAAQARRRADSSKPKTYGR